MAGVEWAAGDREPKVRFENSTTWVEVRTGWRRHRVVVVSPEKPPPGFTRIEEFVRDLGERAKAAKPARDREEASRSPTGQEEKPLTGSDPDGGAGWGPPPHDR